MIGDLIAQIAQTYLGDEEIQPNQGFKNPQLQDEMDNLVTPDGPWVAPDPWCAALGCIVWTKAYTQMGYTDLLDKLQQHLFSLNSQNMLRKCHADPVWPTGMVPKVGAMAIYGDGDSTTSGHTACAVIAVDAEGINYQTVEGNTIPDGNPGNQSEGYIVATHWHSVNKPHSVTGLNLLRFIYPMEPTDAAA